MGSRIAERRAIAKEVSTEGRLEALEDAVAALLHAAKIPVATFEEVRARIRKIRGGAPVDSA